MDINDETLTKAKQLAEQNGRDWYDMGAYEQFAYVEAVSKDDDYDPTPWCSWCGAKEKKYCDCGPIADNH